MFPVDAMERTGKSKETGCGEGTRLFLADNHIGTRADSVSGRIKPVYLYRKRSS